MTGTRSGSLNSKLEQLEVGESLFLEADSLEGCTRIQRSVTSKTRRPQTMDSWTFTTNNVFAVDHGFQETHLLVRIRRTC